MANTPAPQRRADDDGDGHVLLELEDDNTSLDSLAVKIGRDVTGCTRLPVQGWASCQLAPAAASAAAAEKVVTTLKSVELVMGQLRMNAGFGGAAASAAGVKRPAFRRVGRGRKAFVSIRGLAQEAAAAPNAPPDEVVPAGMLPAECAAGTCSKLWGMNRIGVPALWRQMGTSMPLSSVTRAGTIVDTGADFMNYNVANQVDRERSTTITISSQRSSNSEGGRAGFSSHGTHVFGTIASAWGGNDPSGVAGILGPAIGRKPVSCNVFGQNGDADGASISDIVRCLAHARQRDAHWVVNLSLGGEWSRTDAAVALLRAGLNDHICKGGGIAIVAAHNFAVNVDNPNYDKATYPAAYAGDEVPCLIAVASIDQGDMLSSFSNFGAAVKIAAPGGSILSSVNSNGGADVWAVGKMSGTSMASPHVAGAAMLLMNAFPAATGAVVKDCLLSTATDPVRFVYNPNANLGGGILNVQAAYDCVQQAVAPPLDCTARRIPPCVDAASGVAEPACNVNSTSYWCVAIDDQRKCRYSFKPFNTACNGTSGLGTCRGTGPSCVLDTSRASNSACAQDKTQLCEVPGLCSAAQGCMCNAARRSLTEGCICAAALGFVPVTTAGTGQSRCRWNVSFVRSRFISVPLNARVVLPVNINVGGGTICPGDGRQVIKSVEITEKTACRQVTTVPLNVTEEPLGETCGQYVLSTAKAGATSGSCWRVKVMTMDTRQYNFYFAYQ
ncbi:hypothetical protein OEZ85_010519 [Tetradesmus obliquus]|uniref:Peptidase S8/S53 domain-containing protein n=1 Tax=Tetradesmus obliquus TaxID=3088 RepID=A0ABY8TMI8_TETOB|nr:hypothetical protein OEZ85_010519 [Tetradesmus obliquus]